jgi:hypothetical protein
LEFTVAKLKVKHFAAAAKKLSPKARQARVSS